jgi:hypothetical protein
MVLPRDSSAKVMASIEPILQLSLRRNDRKWERASRLFIDSGRPLRVATRPFFRVVGRPVVTTSAPVNICQNHGQWSPERWSADTSVRTQASKAEKDRVVAIQQQVRWPF